MDVRRKVPHVHCRHQGPFSPSNLNIPECLAAGEKIALEGQRVAVLCAGYLVGQRAANLGAGLDFPVGGVGGECGDGLCDFLTAAVPQREVGR